MTDNKVTLITGGSSGIGAELALKLVERGHRVTITARGSERLDEVSKQADAPDRLLTVQGDAAEYADVEKAVQATVEKFGRLDHAVANAGYATHDGIITGDPEGWKGMILANVLGPALLIRATVAELKKTKGRLVLVSSVAGQVPTKANIYGATKYAVHGMAENTRLAVTEDGIGVTLVAPGIIDTPFWGEEGTPQGPCLSSENVAESVIWALNQPEGVDVNNLLIRPTGMFV